MQSLMLSKAKRFRRHENLSKIYPNKDFCVAQIVKEDGKWTLEIVFVMGKVFGGKLIRPALR